MKRRLFPFLLALSVSIQPALADYVSGGGGSGGSGAVSSVSALNVSVTVSPTTGAVKISLPGSATATSGQYFGYNGSAFGFYTPGGGTVNSGIANRYAIYASTGTVVSDTPNHTITNGDDVLGQNGSVGGSTTWYGSTSGNFQIKPAAATTSWLLNMPSAAPPSNGYLFSETVSGTSVTGTWVAPGAATGYANNVNGYRLTLTSNVPVTTSDVTGATTLYLTQCNGNGICDGTGTYYTPGQLSAAVPSYAHRLYDVSVPNGAASIEFTPWDATPITATITGATAAFPCVLTVSSGTGFSTGDMVFIDGIVGTIGTAAHVGINGKCFPVTVSGTSVTIDNLDTTTLAYTSGGTITRVPQSRNTAVTLTNGVPLLASDSSRYLGTIITDATAGRCTDSTSFRNVYNYNNRKSRSLSHTLWVFSITSGAVALHIPQQAGSGSTTMGENGVQFVTGFVEDAVNMHEKGAAYPTASPSQHHMSINYGLNSISALSGISEPLYDELGTYHLSGTSGAYVGYPMLGLNVLQNLVHIDNNGGGANNFYFFDADSGEKNGQGNVIQ
jgi:hypothetical protein